MSKIVINASNLHSGGGLQVGTSFIYELSRLESEELNLLNVFVSSEIHNYLSRLEVDISRFASYEVFDLFGLDALYSKLNKKIKDSDVVFTIFGPNYLRVKAKNEIVGFAQSWIINFDNHVSKKMSLFSRNILRTKFFIQWLFFLRADHYIVELEHVKEGLIASKGVDSRKISVVYNTVSSLYLDNDKWETIDFAKGNEQLALGVISRDYPHKNLRVLPFIAEELNNKYGIRTQFYVTLNKLEWASKDDFFKEYVSTVGSLSPNQCSSFYEQIDGVVFPSLLECFSATPLEAMVMRKPLFAANRGFVRDVCGSHAMYFDPLDIEDIAENIASYFRSDLDRTEQLQQARNHALSFSSAKGRAEQYLEIIQQYLES